MFFLCICVFSTNKYDNKCGSTQLGHVQWGDVSLPLELPHQLERKGYFCLVGEDKKLEREGYFFLTKG
jgi:hypothetical protein